MSKHKQSAARRRPGPAPSLEEIREALLSLEAEGRIRRAGFDADGDIIWVAAPRIH